MCEIDADGRCDVWDMTPVKAAAKEHRCSCCGGAIFVGDPYVKHFSIHEGEMTNEKVCAVGELSCVKMMDEFMAEHHLVFSPGSMWDALRECFVEEAITDDSSDEYVADPTNPMNQRWGRFLDAMELRNDARAASSFYVAMAAR